MSRVTKDIELVRRNKVINLEHKATTGEYWARKTDGHGRMVFRTLRDVHRYADKGRYEVVANS